MEIPMTCPAPGTAEGLAWHRQHRVRLCDECRPLSPRPWSRRKRAEAEIEHGTYRGYQQEAHHAIGHCAACTAANRDYTRQHRQRTAKNRGTGCTRGLGWPLEDPVMARIGRVA